MQTGTTAREAVSRSPRTSAATKKQTLRIAGVEVTRMSGATADVLEGMKPHLGNPQAILALGLSGSGARMDCSVITDRFPGQPGGAIKREVEFGQAQLAPLFQDDMAYVGQLARSGLGFTLSRVVSDPSFDHDPVFCGLHAVADALWPNSKPGSIQPVTPKGPFLTGGCHAFDKKRFVATIPGSFDPSRPARLVPLGIHHCLELSPDGTKVRVASVGNVIDTVQRHAKAKVGQNTGPNLASWRVNPALDLPAPARALSRGYVDSSGCHYAVATMADGPRRYLGLQLVALSAADKRLLNLAMTNPLSVAKRASENAGDQGDLVAFGPHAGVFAGPKWRKHVMLANLPTIVLNIVRDTA